MRPPSVFLIANGDLRLSANQARQAVQEAMEQRLQAAFARLGVGVKRAHPFDPSRGHGFIDSQKYGIDVFRSVPRDAPVVIAEAMWQYSHHVIPGLLAHRGPILTFANWSGSAPGLVGMLNLNASLTKAGVRYSTLWSEECTDEFFEKGLREWVDSGRVRHDTSHAVPYDAAEVPVADEALGREFAAAFRERKAILGVFDEGCMGMYNAIIPDELLHAIGVFKERLSQSTLYARMLAVKEEESREVFAWLLRKGMKFNFGPDEESDLTEDQVLQQCRMYIAALRLAEEFGCSAIGIQYQQGLKDLVPASDLAEGLLNNVDRPPVRDPKTGQDLFSGEALPHFNEVDECAGLDGLVTYRLWRELDFSPENTLHDVRWGRQYSDGRLDAYVWVFLISGAAPPAHFVGGYAGACSERQRPAYFRLGGGTLKGVSKPGWVVWSRIYVAEGKLHFDTGLAEVVALPERETEERWQLTTPIWPIMHAVLQGISRDQMMARHKSNHIQVAYGPDKAGARRGLYAKAAAMRELGMAVSICGTV